MTDETEDPNVAELGDLALRRTAMGILHQHIHFGPPADKDTPMPKAEAGTGGAPTASTVALTDARMIESVLAGEIIRLATLVGRITGEAETSIRGLSAGSDKAFFPALSTVHERIKLQTMDLAELIERLEECF